VAAASQTYKFIKDTKADYIRRTVVPQFVSEILSSCRVPKIVNITISNARRFPATNTDGESLGTKVQEQNVVLRGRQNTRITGKGLKNKVLKNLNCLSRVG